MANEKVSKGLLLYFSTLDCIEKIDDAELGKFIKTEMNWLAGNTDEPEYEEMGSFFLHSRIKEQIALRGYDAERKRKSRENKKTAQEPAADADNKPQKPKRTREEEMSDWKTALENGKDVYGYWRRFFKTEDEAKKYLNIPRIEMKVEPLPIPKPIPNTEDRYFSGSTESKRDKCVDEWFRSLREDPNRDERMKTEFKDYFLTLTQAKKSFEEVYSV